MSKVFFDLTREFNADGVVAILASGQAVVFYRLALMSKDGDWVVRESEPACRHVRRVLARRGAKHRLAPPLDPRWLAGGWSSHFEFLDEKRRRVRCDFVSRPPRVAAVDVHPSPAGAAYVDRKRRHPSRSRKLGAFLEDSRI
jgi:hypothetical protein